MVRSESRSRPRSVFVSRIRTCDFDGGVLVWVLEFEAWGLGCVVHLGCTVQGLEVMHVGFTVQGLGV